LATRQPGRLTTQILTQKVGGATHVNLGYAHLANGQIQEITNNLNSLKSEKYTYDELRRLLTAQRGPNASIQRKYSYDYDRYGNPSSRPARVQGKPLGADGGGRGGLRRHEHLRQRQQPHHHGQLRARRLRQPHRQRPRHQLYL
jgi:hypothetical protein